MWLLYLEDCWFGELDYLETASNGLSDVLVLEQLVDGVVGRDHEQLMLEVNSTSFDFACAGVSVCPNLNVVKEADSVLIKVIKDDYGLSGVAVPPFVLGLKVEIASF